MLCEFESLNRRSVSRPAFKFSGFGFVTSVSIVLPAILVSANFKSSTDPAGLHLLHPGSTFQKAFLARQPPVLPLCFFAA